MELTLHPYLWNGEGRVLQMDEAHAHGYQVLNLPAHRLAFIANFGAPFNDDWQVLEAVNGIQGDWYGNFASRDDALAALRRSLQ